MQRMKKSIFYFLKRLGISSFYLVLIINLLILLSGKTYLYDGIYQTYLHGRNGPGIYDLDNFNERKIQASNKPVSWSHTKSKTDLKLTKAELDYHEKQDSKAFLILHNDTIIHESYWDEHEISQVSNSFSMSKSIISLLIGIAIDEGKIKSIDEPVCTYLPAFKDHGRNAITIRHLLTMSSGFDWNESGTDPLSENAEAYYSHNLVDLIMRQRVINKPGINFKYQSGNSQLLAFVLEKATAVSLSSYAETKLWGPLGAEYPAYWSLDKKNGVEKAFCCFYATAHDFAKIGSLLANKGQFMGKRIVSESYMNQVIKCQDLVTQDGLINQRYGLHFWVYHNGDELVYYCIGLKGQFIITIPSRKLVIVRIGNYRDSDIQLIDMFNSKRGKINNAFYNKIGHANDLFFYLNMANRIMNVKDQLK